MATTRPNGMPQQLAELWTPLYDEVVWLHARWKIFRQHYAASPERIEVLNRSASAFFLILQNVLGDELQLALSKMADPAQTGKKRNLTLETLLIEVRNSGELALGVELETHLSNLRGFTKILNRRNKYLAHHDLETLLKGEAIIAPSASRKEVGDALGAVAQFMNKIDAHFNGSTTAFDLFNFPGQGADALVDLLEKGLLYREREREEFLRSD